MWFSRSHSYGTPLLPVRPEETDLGNTIHSKVLQKQAVKMINHESNRANKSLILLLSMEVNSQATGSVTKWSVIPRKINGKAAL